VVKNGATTANRRTFFQRPPRKAIMYASGYAISRAISVEMPA
jgi:hypothetical protein